MFTRSDRPWWGLLWVALAPAAGVVLWWNWPEPLLVKIITLAPLVRIGLSYLDEPDRRVRVGFWVGGIAIAVALAMHAGMARVLDGHLLPLEVAWSAWFYAGCLALLEGLDRGLSLAFARVRSEATRSIARLAIILAIVAPSVVAVMQTVRAKVGYTLPAEAETMAPTPFETRTSDGVRIRGYYFDHGHEVTLVVAHGLGEHAAHFMPMLLPLLETYGVNGLFLDFRGHGRSDGHVTSFGYHEQRDLHAAVDWLGREHPEAAGQLIFYGFSMGSAATAAVAAERPETRGVVLDTGFARLTDIAWTMADQLPPGAAHYIYATGLPIASALAGAPLHRVEPVAYMDRIEAPLRVMSSGDPLISPGQTRQLVERGQQAESVNGRRVDAPRDHFIVIGRLIERLVDVRDVPPATDTDAPPSGRFEIGPGPE